MIRILMVTSWTENKDMTGVYFLCEGCCIDQCEKCTYILVMINENDALSRVVVGGEGGREKGEILEA